MSNYNSGIQEKHTLHPAIIAQGTSAMRIRERQSEKAKVPRRSRIVLAEQKE